MFASPKPVAFDSRQGVVRALDGMPHSGTTSGRPHPRAAGSEPADSLRRQRRRPPATGPHLTDGRAYRDARRIRPLRGWSASNSQCRRSPSSSRSSRSGVDDIEGGFPSNERAGTRRATVLRRRRRSRKTVDGMIALAVRSATRCGLRHDTLDRNAMDEGASVRAREWRSGDATRARLSVRRPRRSRDTALAPCGIARRTLDTGIPHSRRPWSEPSA